MTQKTIAILGAVIGAALFAGANAHLIAVAFQSQPVCAEIQPDRAPARAAC